MITAEWNTYLLQMRQQGHLTPAAFGVKGLAPGLSGEMSLGFHKADRHSVWHYAGVMQLIQWSHGGSVHDPLVLYLQGWGVEFPASFPLSHTGFLQSKDVSILPMCVYVASPL